MKKRTWVVLWVMSVLSASVLFYFGIQAFKKYQAKKAVATDETRTEQLFQCIEKAPFYGSLELDDSSAGDLGHSTVSIFHFPGKILQITFRHQYIDSEGHKHPWYRSTALVDMDRKGRMLHTQIWVEDTPTPSKEDLRKVRTLALKACKKK